MTNFQPGQLGEHRILAKAGGRRAVGQRRDAAVFAAQFVGRQAGARAPAGDPAAFAADPGGQLVDFFIEQVLHGHAGAAHRAELVGEQALELGAAELRVVFDNHADAVPRCFKVGGQGRFYPVDEAVERELLIHGRVLVHLAEIALGLEG